MNNAALPIDSEDAAWAILQTPLTETQLKEFCQDIERLFRINPYLEFKEWRRLSENRYYASGRNISQEPAFEFGHELTVKPLPHGLQFDYTQGLKTSTRFIIENTDKGSKLTIVDDYSGHSQSERETRLKEVDKSLLKWASDIQAYLTLWQRWSWLGPWRWYMRRIWQPMKPTARRIVYMLMWITVVEIAFIVLAVGIYWAEYS